MLSTGGPIPEGRPCGGRFCPAGRWLLLIVPAWGGSDDYGCRAVSVRRTRRSPESPEEGIYILARSRRSAGLCGSGSLCRW